MAMISIVSLLSRLKIILLMSFYVGLIRKLLGSLSLLLVLLTSSTLSLKPTFIFISILKKKNSSTLSHLLRIKY